MTQVWLVIVAAAIPLNPIPDQNPEIPNMNNGLSIMFATKATIKALCILKVSPCAWRMPFPP